MLEESLFQVHFCRRGPQANNTYIVYCINIQYNKKATALVK